MDNKKLLSIDEASNYLGLKKPTIYKYVSNKAIPYVKLGARVLFDPEDLDRWIDKRKVKVIGE